jgi:hypothetical protein
MSKRQRTDIEVITACDLADDIEEIQDVIPSFSIENVLTRTKEVSSMLRFIPDDVKRLYALLKDRTWLLQIVPYRPDNNVYLEINCNEGAHQPLINTFTPLGFKTTSVGERYVGLGIMLADPYTFAS